MVLPEAMVRGLSMALGNGLKLENYLSGMDDFTE